MFRLTRRGSLVATLLLLALATSAQAEVPPLINYQGKLTDPTGSPVDDGTYTITFSIYRFNGTMEWTSGPQSVEVTDGLFNYILGSNVPLEQAVISSTYNRYLGIKIGNDPEISPRTQLISVPYAFKVGSIDGAAGGAISGTLTLSDAGYSLPATDGSPGQVVTTDGGGILAWTDMSTSSHWSSVDSVLATNHSLGLTRGEVANSLLGTQKHTQVNFGVACTTGVDGVESSHITISGGYRNIASDDYSTVSGGLYNEVRQEYSVIGGGNSNSIDGSFSSVNGGNDNSIIGQSSAIGGGSSNDIPSGSFNTIAGGYNNEASDYYSTVGGGNNNFASSGGTVPGGYQNVALGTGSFAAGRSAKANHSNTFVWSDGQLSDFASTEFNQFLIRAGNGVGINTSSPDHELDVEGEIKASEGFVFPDGSVQKTATPVGAVSAWLKSYPNTPSLQSGWVECNGQTLNDPESPYHGQVIPDLNNQGRYLKGAVASGTSGGSGSHSHEVTLGVYPTTLVPGPASYAKAGTYTTDTLNHEPPFYRVVWIMKVK